LPGPVNNVDAAPFALQTDHFLWYNFGRMASRIVKA
jgi:hypothetical protein